jgi:MFS family permease
MIFVDDDVEAVAERLLRVGYLHVPLILSHDDTAPSGAWFQLVIIALAEFLGMTLWFSATAVTPALSRELQLSPTEASWLTMAVQGGFVGGTLVAAFVNLADLVSARTLVCAGAMLGALANAAVLLSPSPWGVIALRSATGVALAAVYPPAMKMAAGWFKAQRGLALGLLIGALTLGKAVPYLITTLFGDAWRRPMALASALAVVGGVLVLAFATDGPYLAPATRFDPHAIRRILSIRGARLAIAGYLGHMWELYAMWTWVGVYATASFTAAGLGPAASRAGSLAAFLAIGSGAAGCGLAGYYADRLGKARVAGWSLATSAICSALTVVAFGHAPFWTFTLVMVWGFAVVADSAQFSALVSEYAPAEHVGTALTFQTSLGFLLTMVTIDALPRLATGVGWQYAGLLLVPGPVLGAVAMRRLTAPVPAESVP